MPTNFYFDHYQNRTEQTLIENLTIEAIKMYGMDVIYLPRETIERDDIFGEDIISRFSDNYMIEMYLETVDGFEGQQDFLAKFGLQVIDTATFIVAKRRFEEVIWGKERPMEGDLIYMPLSNAIFEVNFVEHENPFYQIGKLHSYKLTVELYTHSHEEFDTGNKQIDRINTDRAPDVLIDKADNKEILEESDDVLDKFARNERIHVEQEIEDFDENNPFGDL